MLDFQEFKAVKIEKDSHNLTYSDVGVVDIDQNGVLVRVEYSVFNHKDLLVWKGIERTRRSYPHTLGIDAAGTIVLSNSNEFTVGEQVVVMATQAGLSIGGGYANYISVPVEKLSKIPQGFSARDVMLFGTAGLTAALAVSMLLENKASTGKPVLVTGGSGAVGILSALILHSHGLEICVSTGSVEARSFLTKIGINNFVDRVQNQNGNRFAILPERWQDCIDVVGGPSLASISKSMAQDGRIFSIGSVADENVQLNLSPFYLRGVRLVGVNAESLSNFHRNELIYRFFTRETLSLLDEISLEHRLEDVPQLLESSFFTQNFGRHLIKV
jgi:putative YhdH/YhfP family quinone oxidoreductase